MSLRKGGSCTQRRFTHTQTELLSLASIWIVNTISSEWVPEYNKLREGKVIQVEKAAARMDPWHRHRGSLANTSSWEWVSEKWSKVERVERALERIRWMLQEYISYCSEERGRGRQKARRCMKMHGINERRVAGLQKHWLQSAGRFVLWSGRTGS
jgi:hypothetical protein